MVIQNQRQDQNQGPSWTITTIMDNNFAVEYPTDFIVIFCFKNKTINYL